MSDGGGRTRRLAGTAGAAVVLAVVGATSASAAPPRGAAVFDIPAFGTCFADGRLTVRVRAVPRVRWVRATISVNGRRVRLLTGRRITQPVTLTGLDTPLIALALSAATSKGRLVVVLRTYHACWAMPQDGPFADPGENGLTFSLTDGGTRIRDVADAEVPLSCTSVGGDVAGFAVAEVPIAADGTFASVTTQAGEFRGSAATFTHTFEGRSVGAGFTGRYRVDVAYAGGAEQCSSSYRPWSAASAAP